MPRVRTLWCDTNMSKVWRSRWEREQRSLSPHLLFLLSNLVESCGCVGAFIISTLHILSLLAYSLNQALQLLFVRKEAPYIHKKGQPIEAFHWLSGPKATHALVTVFWWLRCFSFDGFLCDLLFLSLSKGYIRFSVSSLMYFFLSLSHYFRIGT